MNAPTLRLSLVNSSVVLRPIMLMMPSAHLLRERTHWLCSPSPLRLIGVSSSLLLSILAHQQPNAKKLRRKEEQAEHLAAKGVVSRRERLLGLRRAAYAAGTPVREKPVANNNPERGYYDLWGEQREWAAVSVDDGSGRVGSSCLTCKSVF